MEFKIGERVSFQLSSTRWSQECPSATTRNQSQSSAMTEADEGGQWTVSQGVLPKGESSGAARKTGRVIDAHELGDPFRRGMTFRGTDFCHFSEKRSTTEFVRLSSNSRQVVAASAHRAVLGTPVRNGPSFADRTGGTSFLPGAQ